MAEKQVVTTDKGKEYEVTKEGTLKDVPDTSGGIVGALVNAGTGVVENVVNAVLPDSGDKKGK